MTFAQHSRYVVALCLALLGSGCLAEQITPSLSSPQGPGLVGGSGSVTGNWVFHVDAAAWASSITLATITPNPERLMGWRAMTTPSVQWDGTPAPDLGLSSALGRSIPDSDAVEWIWRCPSGEVCRMRYRVVADTARGQLFMGDSTGLERTYAMFGVRLSPGVFARASTPAHLAAMPDSTPTILLWLADDPPQDRDFIVRLRARGLTATLAIPTYFVGNEGRPGWNELRQDRALGFEIVAHSRRHSAASADGPDFVGEVLGSMADLDSMGFTTGTFVEPGNWPEAIAFDSTSKFKTWRGSLIRTFVWVFASHMGLGSLPEPVTPATAYGIGHWTVSDGLPDSTILSLWRQANRRGHFTTFAVHTWRLSSPGRLDWFLDSLSYAKSVGRVRVLAGVALPPPAFTIGTSLNPSKAGCCARIASEGLSGLR